MSAVRCDSVGGPLPRPRYAPQPESSDHPAAPALLPRFLLRRSRQPAIHSPQENYQCAGSPGNTRGRRRVSSVSPIGWSACIAEFGPVISYFEIYALSPSMPTLSYTWLTKAGMFADQCHCYRIYLMFGWICRYTEHSLCNFVQDIIFHVPCNIQRNLLCVVIFIAPFQSKFHIIGKGRNEERRWPLTTPAVTQWVCGSAW
ncbi:hypothetical protein MHYP_G00148270 [Metynnis hypsauchen]